MSEVMASHPNGVLQCPVGPNVLQVIPFRRDIIRVRFGPAESVNADYQQTWLLAQPESCEGIEVQYSHDVGILTTGCIRAIYDRAEDHLRFERCDGQGLLAETQSSPRCLNLSDTKGAEAWSTRQRFRLQADESLFGLGQTPHQVLRLNERSLDLCQENPIIVVPMLLSSKHYGIFWNSGAHCAFNRVTGPIPSSCLRDDDGEAGGLTTRRYSNTDLAGDPSIQRSDTIDAEWRGARVEAWLDAEDAAEPLQPFSIRWSGNLIPEESGRHTFKTCFPDGCRIWINDRLILDSRGNHSWVNIEVDLEAGCPHKLIVESVQPCDWRGAFARLWWSPPAANDTYSLWSQTDDCIDYFLVAGECADDVIAGFRHLTGRASMLPRWAYGLWQSKEHYHTAEELTDVVKEFRKRRIPLDVIVQDWRYWDPLPWGSMRFDPQRYPDPTGLVSDLHEKFNTRLLLSIWSDFHPASDTHAQFKLDGLLLPEGFRGDTQFIDMFQEAGRNAYWQLIRDRLAPIGADAWWLDCTEPKFEHPLIASTLSKRLKGVDGEDRDDRLNSYGLEASRAVYEGARTDYPDKRVTILNRSGFAGSQRFGTIVWSGDIYADWQTLREQVVAGLNCCASGVPYWNSDIGGFFSKDPEDPAYAELFVRWLQFGCFCPIMRIHGTNFAKEPWRFPEPYASVIEQYIRLRYELLPYIYSTAGQTWLTNSTMMRPLVVDFASDAEACRVNDQYMFGPSLMVCPVLEPASGTRCVYLPKGCDWYNYWTGKPEEGGRIIQAECPLEVVPVYVPAGAILPTIAPIQHTGELAEQAIRLRYYPGGDGSFLLYEDSGDGYGYEQGEYSTIPLEWRDAERQFIVHERNGEYPLMRCDREFVIADKNKNDVNVRYLGKTLNIRS